MRHGRSLKPDVMAIVIEPLTPKLLPEWLNFFDNIAFADNPAWADCYCCCYQLACSNEEWGKRTKGQNRNSSIEYIKAGKMKGYLAFENSLPVGWCNVNEHQAFPRMSVYKGVESLVRKGKTASVICFIIAHTHRGKGIARMMLRQAASDYSGKGFDFLEAFPRTGVPLTPADQFHGPLQLYLSEGFEVSNNFEKYAVVNKRLNQ